MHSFPVATPTNPPQSARGDPWNICHGFVRSRLPLDVWERIIDQLWTPIGEDYWYPTTLRSCTLVCRGFLPRARYHLWRSTMVQRASQTRRLLFVIQGNPSIGHLVQELQIYPSSPGIEYGCSSFYLMELSHALPNLSFLCLKRVNWTGYPLTYNCVIAQFRSLSVLHLWFARFRTAADFFRLLWSLSQVRTLIVYQRMFIQKPLSSAAASKLSAVRKPWSCKKLSTLRIGYLVCEEDNAGLLQFPPKGAFGDSVTTLSLRPQGSRLSIILENISCYTRGLTCLRSIELSLRLSAVMVPPHPDDAIQARSLLPHIASMLYSSSSTLQSVSITVSGMSPGSHLRFLQVLVGFETQTGLLRERLPGLRMLHLRLHDRDVEREAVGQWMKRISRLIPSLQDIVHIDLVSSREDGRPDSF